MFKTVSMTLSLVGALALTAPSYIQAAEISGHNTQGRLISETKFPAAAPKGNARLTVREWSTTSDNPDWNDTKGVWYTLSIKSGKSREHMGYIVRAHKNGGTTITMFEGKTLVKANPDKSWEATWEGTWRSVGGTGKFEKITGSGTYDGSSDSKQHHGVSWKGSVDY